MHLVRFEPTPIEAADGIRHYLEDKDVVDLGGGDGGFALALAQYAKSVTVVELDERLAAQAQNRGLNVIIGDLMEQDLSQFDCIFVFLNLIGTYLLTTKLRQDRWQGTVISHFYPLQNRPLDFLEGYDLVLVGTTPLLVYDFSPDTHNTASRPSASS